jgi:REP element-mobilizing transposase RayT
VHPERKNIRLPAPRYTGRGIHFLTFCCENRRPVFSDPARANWLISSLRGLSNANDFNIHAFCIMPDHAHFLLEGRHDAWDLLHFAKTFKQISAFHFKKETGERLWQRSYYDHILRPSESLDAVAWYIWLNPVRAGICQSVKEYPYSGSFTVKWDSVASPANVWTPPWNRPT